MHNDKRIYVLRLNESVQVSLPPQLEELVGVLEELSPHEVFGEQLWQRLLPLQLQGVFGPSIHHYATGVDAADLSSNAYALTTSDANALRTLQASMPADDWSEGGMVNEEDSSKFGLWHGDELVAVSKLSNWNGEPDDIGVVVHPTFRRHGYGAAVVTAAANSAIESRGIVRYRALATNTASRKLAARLGFREYGENLSVRLL